jgi:hypothetical protein
VTGHGTQCVIRRQQTRSESVPPAGIIRVGWQVKHSDRAGRRHSSEREAAHSLGRTITLDWTAQAASAPMRTLTIVSANLNGLGPVFKPMAMDNSDLTVASLLTVPL